MDNTYTFKCVICGQTFYGFGNNPAPVKNTGRCCDDCDSLVVIPTRIKLFLNKEKENDKIRG